MQPIHTTQAPAPAGHYVQAMVHGGLAYVSGLVATTAEGVKCPGEIEKETALVLANLDAVLAAAGTSRNHVLKVTAFITDIELWARFNAAFAQHFGEHRPARAVVPISPLAHGFKLELEAIAAVPGK